MLKIVGIDPGLAATGVAVIEGTQLSVTRYSYGCIRTSARHETPIRLNRIYNQLSSFLNNQSPAFIVVEDVFSLDRFPKSGIVLGKVTGVILLAACRLGLPVREVPVRVAKQVLTGNGSAGKKQLAEVVRHRLNHAGPIRPYHAADALALAMVGLFRYSDAVEKDLYRICR
ncbi:MAG: crossover junction endodeoxyribonuclease RuvC [Desulfobacterales bacterium]|nr:crossover junction endodeoxyribonuclease RuvC [Desulfobacterales bacterium]